MGTPTEDKWGSLVDLPEWKPENFEKQPGEKLSKLVPKLDEEGLDLLS